MGTECKRDQAHRAKRKEISLLSRNRLR
jgi:hypothetical protein